MIPSMLLRKLGICFSLVAALGLATFASTASGRANGAQTFTQVDKNVVTVGPARNPCTGDPGTLTTTFNDVFHLTINETGSAWFTGVSEGKAVLVPDDPSLPTYTGQFANYFANDTLDEGEFHFTSNIEARGSDGSHLKFHGNGVVELNANGVLTVAFADFFCR